MSIKFKPISQIKIDLGIQPKGEVNAFLTNTVAKKMDRYVPKGDTGNLRNVTTITKNTITYEMPYAHYQYIGKLYVDAVTGSSWGRKGEKKVPTEKNLYHPEGYSYWDKVMWSIEKDNVLKEVQDFIKKKGNL